MLAEGAVVMASNCQPNLPKGACMILHSRPMSPRRLTTALFGLLAGAFLLSRSLDLVGAVLLWHSGTHVVFVRFLFACHWLVLRVVDRRECYWPLWLVVLKRRRGGN